MPRSLPLAASRQPRRRRARGFTLTELMVVVTLVGIMATLGVVSFRSQVSSASSAEAVTVIQAIRAAQEAYRGENQVYLNVSTANLWYPTDTYGDVAYSFVVTGHSDYARWQRLGPQVTRPVKFRYLVNAGAPGQALPDLHIDGTSPSWPTPTEPWYVVQARADHGGDNVFCNALASSFNSEVYIEQTDE